MASSSSSVGSGPTSSDEVLFPSIDGLSCTGSFLSSILRRGSITEIGENEKEQSTEDDMHCTMCKDSSMRAVAGCTKCFVLLCFSCLETHHTSHPFDNRDPIFFIHQQPSRPCLLHGFSPLVAFCFECKISLCQNCSPGHVTHRSIHLPDLEPPKSQSPEDLDIAKLNFQYLKAQKEIDNTWDFYRSVLDERKKTLLGKLETAYREKRLELTLNKGMHKGSLIPRTLRDYMALDKQDCPDLRQTLANLSLQKNDLPDIEFVSNFPAIQTAVRNTFGYVRSGCEGRFLVSNLNSLSKLVRVKMSYCTRFGDYGLSEGQFTEPSGISCDPDNNIIVADANNHRVQIFNQWGKFKLQFGECGKAEGQLMYPNRVVYRRGEIVISERSPSHQIQVFDCEGNFIRKFGSDVLGHPRAITIDPFGRIIVVECKVMRVLIFDENGNVLSKFDCSQYLEFPNGVAVNDRCEIFISDNRSHCIRVFNYSGAYLRQIGAPGITNYPIGVGINPNGHLLVGDNHNNFNLTVFTQEGTLIGAYESKVKHAQCFDMTVMNDCSVAMASRDHRIYIYRFPTNSIAGAEIKKPLL